MKKILHKISGRKWKPPKPNRRWQDNPQFVAHFDNQMCREFETGYTGAIRKASGGKTLSRAISVGAGTGVYERDLVKAGLVEHFDLFEVSADRVEQSQKNAADAGMSKNFSAHLADALEQDFDGEYDLVFWRSALHHMFDVDKAVEWSVRALKPGGHLVVSEYIGPTRLQWLPIETNTARQFLKENHHIVGVAPKRVRRRSPFRRFKQFLRDPSEAPQSNLIPAAYEKHTGQKMTVLGGSVIHLCGGFMTGLEEKDPSLHDRVIALDESLRDRGIYHFGFGLWTKPEQERHASEASSCQP